MISWGDRCHRHCKVPDAKLKHREPLSITWDCDMCAIGRKREACWEVLRPWAAVQQVAFSRISYILTHLRFARFATYGEKEVHPYIHAYICVRSLYPCTQFPVGSPVSECRETEKIGPTSQSAISWTMCQDSARLSRAIENARLHL